jgi:hypothetical protein
VDAIDENPSAVRISKNGSFRIPTWMTARPLKSICLFLLLSGLRAGTGESHAQDFPTAEYEIKAAFIFNIAKFVEWPAAALKPDETTFTIGILGKDPFGDVLDATLGGKTLKGRAIAIKRFQQLSEVGGCQILFISESEKKRMNDILARLDGESVLTVSDQADFARNGGMFELYLENNRVKFAVHTEAAERANLKVSAKLLNLAKVLSD